MKKTIITAAAALLVLTGCGDAPEPLAGVEVEQTQQEQVSLGDHVDNAVDAITSEAPSLDIDLSDVEEQLNDMVDSFTTEQQTAPENGPVAYDRSAFTHWIDLDGNGCDERQDTLARDLENVKRNGCTVEYGEFYDPASGKHITFTNDGNGGGVDIDHIVPLAYAAEHGAAMQWSEAKRTEFANTADNLLAMDASANRSKGDSGPSEWMPADPAFACDYATAFDTIAQQYGITVPAADAAAIAEAC